MKRILCFGDSNTWGMDPNSSDVDMPLRLSAEKRWTGILAKTLGDGFAVIEEGLIGRTTVLDDPIVQFRNGKDYLPPCLETHKPIDCLVIMLGTNDLKSRFNFSPTDIALGLRTLLEIAKKSRSGSAYGEPNILLITPPPIGKLKLEYQDVFTGAHDKCRVLPQALSILAGKYGCQFLDSHEIISVKELVEDGIHLPTESHAKLALAVSEKIFAQIRR